MSRRIIGTPHVAPFRFAAVLLVLFAAACGSSVKEIDSTTVPNASERRQYRIECIQMDDCKKKASAACGSPYDVVSEWHNQIPESELPGLNEQSRVKDSRDWKYPTMPNRT